MNNNKNMILLQKLNLAAFVEGEREDTELDSAMYYSKENICEMHMEKEVFGFEPDGKCITKHGIYFGTTDSHEPKFCPAHYFGDTGYTVEAIK